MKNLYFFAFISLTLFSCDHKTQQVQELQKRIDSLQHELKKTYKPGLGDFMVQIQMHHSKLWFAGKNGNWKLADFETHEILEAVDDIKKYQSERKETQMIDIINPVLDSVELAITQKDTFQFKNSFTSLTHTCNNCHHETGFAFNVIQIPTIQPFSNQNFKPNK